MLHSAMDSITHAMPLNNLAHCLCCTTLMTSLKLGRDSNPVLLSFKPQPDRMSPHGLYHVYLFIVLHQIIVK